MKKWLSLLLIAVILLSMTACGGGGGSDKPAGNSDVDKLVSEYGLSRVCLVQFNSATIEHRSLK